MCLTYTGDLLADAFISGYSKMVNFIYRQICRGRLKNCVPDETRRSFEQQDVRQLFPSNLMHSRLCCSRTVKKVDMYRSSLRLQYWPCTSLWVPYSLLNGRTGTYSMALTFVLSRLPPSVSVILCPGKERSRNRKQVKLRCVHCFFSLEWSSWPCRLNWCKMKSFRNFVGSVVDLVLWNATIETTLANRIWRVQWKRPHG